MPCFQIGFMNARMILPIQRERPGGGLHSGMFAAASFSIFSSPTTMVPMPAALMRVAFGNRTVIAVELILYVISFH
jgi:hypothetical protein